MSSRVSHLRCFSFLFNYPGWSEPLLTGTLLLFIPIAGPLILHGWGIAVMHRRIRGEEGLPTFLDMFGLIRAGLMPLLATVVAGIPFAVVGIALATAVALASPGAELQLEAWAGGELWRQAVILVVGLVLLAVVFSVWLGVSALLQVVRLRVEVTGRFSSAFELREVTAMFRVLGGRFMLGTLILGAAGPVIYALGLLLLVIGSYPATTLVSLSWSELRTQLYRAWLAEGHAPLADSSYLDERPLMLGPEV